jgi:quercetin dioxygenase-like cupin family protein
VSGSRVATLVDPATPDADLYAGVNALEPNASIPLHTHDVGELQFILSGVGIAHDARNGDIAVGPHSSVFAPAGRAHGFTNTGPLPLVILFVYPSAGGAQPTFTLFEDDGT